MKPIVASAIALALSAGLLAACGGTDQPTSDPDLVATITLNAPPVSTAAAAAPPATTAVPAASTAVTTTHAPEPAIMTVRVVDEKPEGGVAKLKVRKGDRIRFVVESDTTQNVHLHGYDVELETGIGKPAEFDLKATIEGVFEVELEDPGVQILKLSVTP